MIKFIKTKDEEWPMGGRIEMLQRLNRLPCFLFPEGGAKLLEEKNWESKVKRLACVHTEALKNSLVSWQFLFQGSSSSLVLASSRFQKWFTCTVLFMCCLFPLNAQPHINSMTGFTGELDCVYHINGRFIRASVKRIFKGKRAFHSH